MIATMNYSNPNHGDGFTMSRENPDEIRLVFNNNFGFPFLHMFMSMNELKDLVNAGADILDAWFDEQEKIHG